MSSAVVGFDVGNSTSYIAVAKRGGIETIVNDYSDRCTPILGTSAKQQHVTNFQRTFTNFASLLGKTISDPSLEIERKFCTYDIQPNVDGRLKMNVMFHDENFSLSPEQLFAMHLNKLKELTEKATSSKVVDIVLNCPTYYNDHERRALLDAVQIAGMNCVKLVNDTTAVATTYGLSNRTFPDADKPAMNVAFVIVGQTSTQVAICAFHTGKMNVVATASDPHLGGRDFDQLLVSHFADEFNKKYKTNLKPEEIAGVELVGGSVRIPALQKIISSIFKQEVKSTLNQDEAVARGCAFQAAICSPAFKVRDFSVTDVCQHPIYLRWDKQGDISQNTDKHTEVACNDDNNSLLVVPHLFSIPCSRQITLTRNGLFEIEAIYGGDFGSSNDLKVIGTFKIDLPLKSEPSKVRIKLRVNTHGIFSVSRAQLQEEYEKEVEVEVPKEKETKKDTPPPMETDSPDNGDTKNTQSDKTENGDAVNDTPTETAKVMKTKKFTKYDDLRIDSIIVQYNTSKLNEFTELEGKLCAMDRQENERCVAKNAVEEYVYDMRTRLRESLDTYATQQEKSNLLTCLDNTEDWLYGDGENLNRQAYVDRLEELGKLGNVILFRQNEVVNRPAAVEAFQHELVMVEKVLTGIDAGEDSYDHLTEEQVGKLRGYLNESAEWINKNTTLQSKRAAHETPAFKVCDVKSQHQAFCNKCKPILSTPKPAPPPVPATDEQPDGAVNGSAADDKQANENNVDETAPDAAANGGKTNNAASAAKATPPNHMEVD